MTEEKQTAVELPLIKYIKLKTGDCIVAMVEFGKEERSDEVTLYNPFKIVYNDIQATHTHIKIPFIIEEWLPSSIVIEQVCTIFNEDIMTMVDVNTRFLESYTKTVMKKILLEETLRRGNLMDDEETNSVGSNIKLSEDEEEELANEEFGEMLDEKIKKIRERFN